LAHGIGPGVIRRIPARRGGLRRAARRRTAGVSNRAP